MASQLVSRPVHPHPLGTVIYPATLLAVFLGNQLLLSHLGVAPAFQASLAAIPAVTALVISLPIRVRRVWNEPRPWWRLGIRGQWPAVVKALGRGLMKALLLLILVTVGLACAGQISWHPRLSPGLLANSLALGLGVGFAEELLFRGWLEGELGLLMGSQRALWVQAALFSLVHTRFNLAPELLLGLLGGLLLLGLALGLQRRADGGLIWGAIGLHGGLVGGWFLMNQGLAQISPGISPLLNGANNPIGGALGWFVLILLLLARRPWWSTPVFPNHAHPPFSDGAHSTPSSNSGVDG